MSHAKDVSPASLFDISGKVCLIAGGTSGIGRAIALACAAAGAKVVAGSTSPAKVQAMQQELGDAHDALILDVTDPQSVQQTVDHVVARHGRIDALVNAAGAIKRSPTMDLPLEEWERLIRINLTGTFLICQAVGRVMRRQKPDAQGQRGAIVNIASLNTFVAFEGVCGYAAAKAGVGGLTRSLANDWAQYGIRVNAIAPGVVPTEFNRKLIDGTPRGQWLKDHTPLGRFGTAQEMVGAAIYLISPGASYTTGQIIAVDGGFLARGVGIG
jgi:NAD(P)-dependent dehydrogenase (short-subunit alcohol dehydrogenase family)